MKQAALLILTLMLLAFTVSAAEVEYLNSEATASIELPFSDAVRVGDVIILSGQLGTMPGELRLVEGGIAAETHQIFANINRILEQQGSSLDKVFKCTVMMEEIGEWPAFNEIYVTYFPGNKPARSAFGADGLALGAAVEMECWAVR